MSNALATITDSFNAEIAALLGQSGGNGQGSSLARLAVNTDHIVEIDGQDYQVPAGSFKTKDETGQVVYLSDFTFRPMMQRYHWSRYDENANEGKGGITAASIYIAKHSEEPYDDQGGVACGKLRGKAARDEANLSDAQKLIQKAVQSFRLVWGTVTGVGKTALGNEVTLKDYPVELRLRGVNYMPFGEEVEEKLNRSKRMLPQVELKLTTKRQKKGSTVYYIIGYDFDPTKLLTIDAATIATIQQFADHAKTWNEGIMEKHKAAMANRSKVSAPNFDDGLDADWAESGSEV